ncbi:MAG: DUF5005 domain-containing protein [Flavobacteriales bacterium]|nr:DUF5005 domain-containing protein [Flavobacteriales bacterium]
MKTSYFLVAGLLAIGFSSCQKEPQSSPVPTIDGIEKAGIMARPVGPFNQLFTRYSGWSGGDQGYSIRLPDGRDLWLFGDSFIDTVFADRTRPSSPLVRNAYVVQQGNQLTTLNQTVGGVVQPIVATQDPSEWFWPGDGFVSGNSLYIFQQRMKNQGSGVFGFAQTGVDLARFSLPDLTLQEVTPFTYANDIAWGMAVMEDGDYVYIYGTKSQQYNKYIQVARTPIATPFSTLEFWNGTVWTTDDASTVSIRNDVSQSYSVFKHAGKYYLLSQEGFLGPDINMYRGNSPTGPFQRKQLVATTPVPASTWTYNALAHPQYITAQGDLLINYSINVHNFFDLFQNADHYRPIFFRARGWE